MQAPWTLERFVLAHLSLLALSLVCSFPDAVLACSYPQLYDSYLAAIPDSYPTPFSQVCLPLLPTQAHRSRNELAIAMSDAKKHIDVVATAVAGAIATARDATVTLRSVATQDKKPQLQLLYFQAAVRTQGEVFDVTCFAGVSQYHCLRAHGECGHAHLSSCHLRSTDFELACQAEDDVPAQQAKEVFARNTRSMFMQCMVYTAAIHLAWEQEPNHESISHNSAAVLQTSRADLNMLQTAAVDPACQIVTVVLDVVTDRKHFHLASDTSGLPHDTAYDASAARTAMKDDDTSGHQVPPEEVAEFAAKLAANRSKDMVPHSYIAAAVAPLADKCHALEKELHLLLIGCNTIRAVPALKQVLSPASAGCVSVVCTSEVWPSDCSTLLWHLYGALARTGGLDSFRSGTRTLLGEYTDHYKRQRILDESRAELKLEGSLANALHFGRLDQVEIGMDGLPQMDLL